MNGIKVPGFMSELGAICRKNAPTIMSVTAVGGVFLTAYLAYKAKPKYDEVLKASEEAKKEIREKHTEVSESGEETVDEEAVKKDMRHAMIDKIIGTVKVFLPAVLAGIVTGGLILGANHINLRRIAIYAGAYEIASGDLQKYKEKLSEVVGEKKAEEVEAAVSTEKVKEACGEDGHPTVIYQTGRGDQLYYDSWSGRFFRSDRAAIQEAITEIVENVPIQMFVSLNEWYEYIGLPEIGAGEEFGFSGRPYIKEEPNWVETPAGDKAIALSYTPKVRQRYGDLS